MPARLVTVLAQGGIDAPFPIQSATLPDTLSGRDVLARGKTGSGKTLGFSIPVVARIAEGTRVPGRPRALVLAPTRELATQISAVIEPLAAAYRMKVTTIFGGVSQHRQVQALKSGVDIVVACPGRLDDLLKQRHLTLDGIEITVLDEADHMADLGFLPVVTRLLAATPNSGQRLLFSATLDNDVDKLVKRFLHSPAEHSVDSADSPVAAMTHHVFTVAGPDAKRELINTLASGSGRRILFMRTKHHAKRLAHQLTQSGIPSVDLHGNLSQGARDRNLAAFSNGDARVLVATDVAARGVHVDDVALVVHVDPPAEHKAYLHRSGRTARAGGSGDVVTLVLPEQRRDVDALLRKAAIKATPRQVTADSPEVSNLVGEIAPYVKPAPAQKPNGSSTANGQRSQRPRGGAEGRPARTPRRGGQGQGRQGQSQGRQGQGQRSARRAGNGASR
ncbi:DEAD/DEAH box helicase [Mycobacteroides immunogenum]|uniref:DEAD/DEAH box helicase n=1 Tax=Mycobacteroides immunogenum TaxID=83262 RepID=A0A7V8RW22_9MYCO|nr:DEAD/DEAH box helicase [Mycobacteroides immunogenum]ANO03933.1 DEAD/DEAH box helicase [Mycobacteroides immunogenum]KIU38908.1 DEAD/DEAH box helicase [Mycobacteroides immunogenum]KPG09156.1 DEAD/DEAH box helicase [Mycobacteroides immunogenum]KPG09230.1 DEAD/DEAH box helicase [Mycobacteroides immunogenum]KPG10316.1 DEAD/DEAH box helicase [Mycobacteroides immunogenum]